nr:unnamed protein product [Naegleria fowleri]
MSILLSCLKFTTTTAIFLIAAFLGVVLFYPFPKLDQISKEWPLKTIEEYEKKMAPMMASHGVHLSFFPKKASWRKIKLSNGMEMNMLEGGKREGDANQKLLIFMHGYPETALLCWGRYLDHFIEKGYWVIAPDMRGFNESSKPLPENVDMQQVMNFPKSFSYGAIKKYLSDLHRTSYLYTDKYYAEDYYLLVTEYAKRDKAIFITHDWGSGAASYVRREHPEIFERLVMGVGNFLNTQFIKNRPLDFVKQLLKSWYIFFFQVLGVSDVAVSRDDFSFLLFFTGFDELGRQGRMSVEELNLWANHWRKNFVTATSIYRGAFRNSKPPQKLENKSVPIPILYIHGENDRYITSAPMYFFVENILTEEAKKKSSVYEVKNAPHWTQLYGEEIIPQIEKFIASA